MLDPVSMLISGFRLGLFSLAMLHASQAGAQVTSRTDTVGKWLNEWHAAGTAAGLSEITYENRDGKHSPLPPGLYPQLQTFQPDAKSGPPTGPAVVLRLNPTVGNCSMSAPADKGGSLPRMYQMDPSGQKFLMMQYLANNLMIYPEHQDHDPGANGIGGYGDMYPSNNACTLITQGSSGSDQPFLKAILATLAAFPPDTQRTLIQKRLLIPTVQSLFRQANRQVKTETDYFTGKAHPVVFDAADLDEEKMVRLAHEMRPPMIPPVVQMEVLKETAGAEGKDFFEAGKPHPSKLADTPVSIARIMRERSSESTLVISARKSADLMGRPVKLQWHLLQGDPRFVSLESSPEVPEARVRVRWQPPIQSVRGLLSHRIDIGVFASNGISTSAPAFITFYLLPNERHFYDAQGRVSEIYYQAHNPDLGLPTSPRDLRWLQAMRAISITGEGLRSRLTEKLLPPAERLAISQLWQPLNEQWLAQQKIESDPAKKEESEKLKNRLLDDVAKALHQPLSGNPGSTARLAIEHSLEGIVAFTDLFPAFQKELLTLAAKSPKTTAVADIATEVKRLQDLNILLEENGGTFTTATAPDKLTSADRYYLSGLNRTLLSQVLFPEVLERSLAPAWVDPRLTTPKPWRDVNRYDESGRLIGWIRHQGRRTAWFDPEGRHLPEGPKKPELAQPVVYEKTEKGVLDWRVR